jgi:hypothetical protein
MANARQVQLKFTPVVKKGEYIVTKNNRSIPLVHLREKLDIPQTVVAKRRGVSQASLSFTEQAGRPHLATVLNYVTKGLGAGVEVFAVVKGERNRVYFAPERLLRRRGRPLKNGA